MADYRDYDAEAAQEQRERERGAEERELRYQEFSEFMDRYEQNRQQPLYNTETKFSEYVKSRMPKPEPYIYVSLESDRGARISYVDHYLNGGGDWCSMRKPGTEDVFIETQKGYCPGFSISLSRLKEVFDENL